MKRIKTLLLISLFLPLPLKGLCDENPPTIQRPNAISVELLGRGLGYSLNYDRLLSDQFGIGGGFTLVPFAGGADGTTIYLPVYGNYYFSPKLQRGFLTGGLNFFSLKGENTSVASFSPTVTFTATSVSSSGAFFVLGGGYESREDSGFLFRITAYIFSGSSLTKVTHGRTIMPWIGISLGTVF